MRKISRAVVVAVLLGVHAASGSGRSIAQSGALVELLGVVIDATSHAPVPFAQVQMSARTTPGPENRYQAIADDDGTFTIKGVPPGSYTAAAYKTGYALSYYAASGSPSIEPVRQLTVLEGRATQRVELQLIRGAVIAGKVVDEHGEPAPQIQITARRVGQISRPGPLYFVRPTAGFTTDPLGEYRLYGLDPGKYVVSVSAGSSGSGFQIGTSDAPKVSYVQVFYPDTTDPVDAVPIALSAGEERTGIDFRMRLSRPVNVSGTLAAPSGLTDVMVRMRVADQELTGYRSLFARRSGDRFFIERVPPGRYWITASASAPRSADQPRARAERFWAVLPVTVDDRDLTGLALTLQPTMNVSGRAMLDAAASGPIDIAKSVVELVRLPGAPDPFEAIATLTGQPNAGGQFTIPSVTPGRFRVNVRSTVAGTNLTVVSVAIAGRRLPATELEVPEGMNLSNLEVVIR